MKIIEATFKREHGQQVIDARTTVGIKRFVWDSDRETWLLLDRPVSAALNAELEQVGAPTPEWGTYQADEPLSE